MYKLIRALSVILALVSMNYITKWDIWNSQQIPGTGFIVMFVALCLYIIAELDE